ncbi:MAG TPA: hypothetical protein VN700_00605 [Vicinamibacterales bacterium]|nr:hypothetical protein [Vicinamibacterales bacterium]
MKMTRRRVLLVFVAAAAAALPIGLWWLEPRSRGRLAQQWSELGRSPAGRLRHHFSYLKLSSTVVEQYLTDHQKYWTLPGRFELWPEIAYARFLMSTTFFRNDADETRQVDYVGFYEPQLTPCNNPLARFDGPEPARKTSDATRRPVVVSSQFDPMFG